MFVFRKIWRALFSWNTRFEVRLFALLPTQSQFFSFTTGMQSGPDAFGESISAITLTILVIPMILCDLTLVI